MLQTVQTKQKKVGVLLLIYHTQFPVWKTNQTLKWEGVWRELGCLARTASFAVREESGHSLKSSLSVFILYFTFLFLVWGLK